MNMSVDANLHRHSTNPRKRPAISLPKHQIPHNKRKPVVCCTINSVGYVFTRLVPIEAFTQEELPWMWENPIVLASSDPTGMARHIERKRVCRCPVTNEDYREAGYNFSDFQFKPDFSSNDILGKKIVFVWHCVV